MGLQLRRGAGQEKPTENQIERDWRHMERGRANREVTSRHELDLQAKEEVKHWAKLIRLIRDYPSRPLPPPGAWLHPPTLRTRLRHYRGQQAHLASLNVR